MKLEKLANNVVLARSDDGAPILSDLQSALDLIVSARHESGCDGLVVMKEDVSEDFFDLKTGVAGEILQKFVNYGCRIAIVGDFSGYTSKSLRDFIYESNKGTTVHFLDTIDAAVSSLSA